MTEERENQKGQAKGEPDVEGHGQHPVTTGTPDVEGHGQHPMIDDADPDETKTKTANDDDPDFEGHGQHPSQTP